MIFPAFIVSARAFDVFAARDVMYAENFVAFQKRIGS